MAKLIENAGGRAIIAPSMREVPLQDNHHARDFVRELIAGEIHAVIFLTGVGAQVVVRVAESIGEQQAYLDALKSVPVIARGPKPAGILRPLGIPIRAIAPEPNTWREVLQALDANPSSVPLRGRTIAVQEYGAPNEELLAGLRERGATVRRVPVYDWQLPEDTGPLRNAAEQIAKGDVDVVLFTTSVQARHVMQIANEMGIAQEVHRGFSRMFVASIGPVTSEALHELGLRADMEPSHPKMGFLVSEAASKANDILPRKQG
ncbi:MAG TPA: uroporphyrinogen-III synthase [Terriglobales bacterium]|nr:uroporphyrinogen-III synthase [Terriglobales bacterium]